MGAASALPIEHFGNCPSESEVRSQLRYILDSESFEATERGRRFLSYVIEEALAGRSNRIKAFSVATEVFGREADFDAQSDPLVRIEAGRLRRNLERYYLLAGKSDRVVISIPKGGYVPAFTFSSDSNAVSLESPTSTLSSSGRRKVPAIAITVVALIAASGIFLQDLHAQLTSSSAAEELLTPAGAPTIIVLPFEDINRSAKPTMLAKALTDEVVEQLVKLERAAIIVGSGDTLLPEPPGASLQHYLVEGRVRMDAEKLRFSARLVLQSDGSVIWAASFDVGLDTPLSLASESKVAHQIVAGIVQGVAFQDRRVEAD